MADGTAKALVFDASGIADSTELVELQRFFHPNAKRVAALGPRRSSSARRRQGLPAREATAQRALEGFTRSLAKEIGRGIAVQLVYVAEGAEAEIDSTLRFLLSPTSAYVSGQVVRVGKRRRQARRDRLGAAARPARSALVTGASRGIGEAIAETLHRDGADLVLLDVPALAEDLHEVAGGARRRRRSSSTSPRRRRRQQIADAARRRASTSSSTTPASPKTARSPRCRRIAGASLMEINLSSEERINDELLARELLRENGRIVCVSSMSGVAGNSGQTNYATSKAGVIGMVEALAPELAKRGATINAVAPGFIETQMTAKMPIAIREAGRRMNSMSQGGLPIDVAETIAWFASPASAGVNGNTVRVCGQSLLGA